MPALCIIPARALADPGLTSRDLRALLAIGKFTSRDGTGVWASRETIAAEARLDESHYKRSLKALIEKGYVRCERRVRADGGTQTSMLSVILDDPVQAELPLDAPAEEAVEHVSGGRGAKSAPRGQISPPGGARTAPPGGAKSAPQTTPYNATASPPPAIATPRTGPPPSGASEAERFEHPDHRSAYLALRTAHRRPESFDAGLREVFAPSTGGAAYSWAVIGAALVQVQANGESFNVSRLRGYCRMHQAGPPVQLVRGADADARAPGRGVRIGAQVLTAPEFWGLCADAGLTSPMQGLEAIGARIRALADAGTVADAEQFTSLVLHVEPWALAEVHFRKDRDERLRAKLATWQPGVAAEAS